MANTLGHWAIASPNPASPLLTWSTQMTATAIIGLFAVLTVRILGELLGRRGLGYVARLHRTWEVGLAPALRSLG